MPRPATDKYGHKAQGSPRSPESGPLPPGRSGDECTKLLDISYVGWLPASLAFWPTCLG